MKRRNFLQIATGSIAVPFILPCPTKANILPAHIDDESWYKILKFGVDRNMLVYNDCAINSKIFSHRLATLGCEVQYYNGGTQLTDIFMPDYAFQQYGHNSINISTMCERHRVSMDDDEPLEKTVRVCCSVRLYPLAKLNDQNVYSNYVLNQLGYMLCHNHKNFAVGLGILDHNSNIQKQDILLMSF